MKNKVLSIVFLLLCIEVNSQEHHQIVFRDFVRSCLDSLQSKSPKKHSKILGIILTTNLKGELTSYELHFRDNEIKLTKKEYKWLFKLLYQMNYKEFLKWFYTEEDLKKINEITIRFKYSSKEERARNKDNVPKEVVE